MTSALVICRLLETRVSHLTVLFLKGHMEVLQHNITFVCNTQLISALLLAYEYLYIYLLQWLFRKVTTVISALIIVFL